MNYIHTSLSFAKEKFVDPVNEYVVSPVNDYVVNPIITTPINNYVITPVNEYVIHPFNKLVKKEESQQHPFFTPEDTSNYTTFNDFKIIAKEFDEMSTSTSSSSNPSFFTHLRQDNKTYFDHLKETMNHSAKSFTSSIKLFIHAIWPDAYVENQDGYGQIN